MIILVADDELRQCMGIAKAVQTIRPSALVVPLANGAEVLRYLRNGPAHMVISDISMPDIDGLSMLEAMRERGMAVPVVFLSGYASFQYAQRAIHMGAFGYLLKPVDPNEVRMAIERVEQAMHSSAGGVMEGGGLSDGDMVRRMQQYLDDHYMNDLSLDAAAAAFGLNPNYFSGLFKALTGDTFSHRLTHVRIENARVLLREPDLSIAEVAEMVGYRAPSYFAKVFKGQVGVSPEQYRRRHGGS